MKFNAENPPNAKNHLGAVIYKISNKLDGKIYIGSSKNFVNRFSDYKGMMCPKSIPNTRVSKTMRKYGFQNFEFEIIEVTTPERRFDREQFWIDQLQPFGETGYNEAKKVTYLPDHTLPKDKLEKMRESSSKTALKYAEETRARSSKPVYKIDMKTLSVLEEFPSALEADRQMGLSHNTVNKVCRRSRPNISGAGFFWSYKNDYDSGLFKAPVKKKIKLCASYYLDIKPINQLDMDDNLIKTWNCSRDILNDLGYTQSPIFRCCRKERLHSNGFKWEYVTDEATIDRIKAVRKTEYENNRFEILN